MLVTQILAPNHHSAVVEGNKTMGEKQKIIIYRESLLQSVIADLFTFLMLGGLFAANHYWFDDSKVSAFVFVILFVIFVLGKAGNRKHVFTDKDKAIEFISCL